MVDRTPRSRQTREHATRRASWKPVGVLPTPEPRDGLHFRWVRTSVMNQSDTKNVSRRLRMDYVPVAASEFPEIKAISDIDSRFPDGIEIGGLLLCAVPREIAERHAEGHAMLAQAQMTAVDNDYMRESDPRMPMLRPERRSEISFGRG